jgi:hypothetical protein
MKYLEIVADKLSAAGWSWGCCSAVTKHGWRWWIVDAHKGADKCYIVQSDELLGYYFNMDENQKPKDEGFQLIKQ